MRQRKFVADIRVVHLTAMVRAYKKLERGVVKSTQEEAKEELSRILGGDYMPIYFKRVDKVYTHVATGLIPVYDVVFDSTRLPLYKIKNIYMNLIRKARKSHWFIYLDPHHRGVKDLYIELEPHICIGIDKMLRRNNQGAIDWTPVVAGPSESAEPMSSVLVVQGGGGVAQNTEEEPRAA